jgi:hypothetical protein
LVCLITKIGFLRHPTCVCCPGSSLDTSTLTGAPTALAFALGFHEAMNGVAANGTPAAPNAEVNPINTFRLEFIFFS